MKVLRKEIERGAADRRNPTQLFARALMRIVVLALGATMFSIQAVLAAATLTEADKASAGALSQWTLMAAATFAIALAVQRAVAMVSRLQAVGDPEAFGKRCEKRLDRLERRFPGLRAEVDGELGPAPPTS